MANQEHLDLLKQGFEVWNRWREKHPNIKPILFETYLRGSNLQYVDLHDADLRGADLGRANLGGADLQRANLGFANLQGAYLDNAKLQRAYLHAKLEEAILTNASLSDADLSGANLSGANLSGANLSGADLLDASLVEANLQFANLSGANLQGANLLDANLRKANLQGAILTGAVLVRAILIETNLTNALLTNCLIYGVSAWDVQLEGATQESLVISPDNDPTITVDNLKIAQFIYLLLNNAEIREAIDTIAKKVVLILGRFTPERKAVLDAIKKALRTHGYLPILFDFDKPTSRDLTETVSTLAHLARFIIADLTEPSSLPKELEAIVPTLAVPVQPLLERSTRPYAMFKDYWKYQWVLETYRYNGIEELLISLNEYVIEPAERKAKELAKLRAREFEKQ